MCFRRKKMLIHFLELLNSQRTLIWSNRDNRFYLSVWTWNWAKCVWDNFALILCQILAKSIVVFIGRVRKDRMTKKGQKKKTIDTRRRKLHYNFVVRLIPSLCLLVKPKFLMKIYQEIRKMKQLDALCAGVQLCWR